MLAAIKPKDELVIAGFCGAIASGIPILVIEEKKIMETCYWYHDTDNRIKDVKY